MMSYMVEIGGKGFHLSHSLLHKKLSLESGLVALTPVCYLSQWPSNLKDPFVNSILLLSLNFWPCLSAVSLPFAC